jgi:hypothetical protein
MICDSYVAPALPKICNIPRFTAGAFYFGFDSHNIKLYNGIRQPKRK